MTDCKTYTSEGISMLWFDLDDTLWDMNGNSIICLRELYDAHDLGRFFKDHEEWDRIYHRINFELWDQYSRGEITRDFLRSERFSRPLREVGVDPKIADELSAKFDTEYLARLGSKTALVPGALELLRNLQAKGYRMGIVSNGFREVQFNKLRSSGIDGFFDVVVLSDDAGYNKPDRRFFEYAERKAGTVGKRNVIVGDNLLTDIKGALAAHWDAVWFNPKQVTVPKDVACKIWVVENLGELNVLK